MKQKLFFVILAFLVAITAWANGTKIDGIYYVLNSSTKTASVTYTGTDWPIWGGYANGYNGNMAIPPSVTYGGTTY
ncbi:MAG: hypothetical protein IKR91_05725, partial [Alloprevotella sp.]|nr:hypothetical protein [Alloprevotella sp.]